MRILPSETQTHRVEKKKTQAAFCRKRYLNAETSHSPSLAGMPGFSETHIRSSSSRWNPASRHNGGAHGEVSVIKDWTLNTFKQTKNSLLLATKTDFLKIIALTLFGKAWMSLGNKGSQWITALRLRMKKGNLMVPREITSSLAWETGSYYTGASLCVLSSVVYIQLRWNWLPSKFAIGSYLCVSSVLLCWIFSWGL